MIFEVDAEQISQLDSVALVQLMKRLLLAECQLVDIPLRATVVPLQITVPDGGEDGRVEWTGGNDTTNYFPSRFCIFQSKAQNLTDGAIKAEVFAKAQKKRSTSAPKLNDAISETLSHRGSYVVFCSQPFTGQKIGKLRRAIEGAIREAGSDPSRLAKLDIYDANKIADWVNTHPAVALWLTNRARRRSVSGFQSLDGWGRSAEIAGAPWVANEAPRFVPASRAVQDSELKDRGHGGWTFAQAAEATLDCLSNDQRIVRIVGPSGFGKSRFTYELFNGQHLVAGEVDSAAVIYANLPIVGEEVVKLALEIADAGWPTILVVDDCPDQIHSTLAEIVQRVGSKLRLVTVDVESRIQVATDTLVITLEPAPDELIGSIARGVAPTLNDADARFIQELANGFPRMAVLAARQGGRRREAILSVEQVLDRIIWGRRAHNEMAQKTLEIVSLFDWLGLSGRVKEQGTYVAREFGILEDTFIEHVRSFKSRGIVVQRGDFVQIQPIPLAVRLAVGRLSLLPDGKLASFFAQASRELCMSLLRRFRWLDTSPTARVFARGLLSKNCMGNLAALNSRFGSEVFNGLVHVEPDAVMASLDRLLGALTLDQLRDIKDGRRYVVWALEKLAFRTSTFQVAAALLRKLGAAETEERIGNNASGQFQQLYHLYLSGTQAGPEERLQVLDEGLRSDASDEQGLCVEALGQMLQTGHFSRVGGGDEIGSSERLEDWTPKTYGDIWDFHRSAMSRLTDIGTSDNEFANRARSLVGSHIRSLINVVPLDDVKAMIKRIVAHVGIWREAIQGVNSWLYFDRRHSPRELSDKVRDFFDQLMPTDPVERVLLYTQGRSADFHSPDSNFDPDERGTFDHEYAVREACRFADTIICDPGLLDRTLQRLVASDGNSLFAFSRRLAELADDPTALFTKSLRIAEASGERGNRQFFRGLIAGIDRRDPREARACIRAALGSPKLKDDAISMIGSGTLQSGDIPLVVSLLQSEDVKPWECATLSYGRGLDHLSPEQIMPLFDELGRHGARGQWAVIDIISMYLHGGKQLDKPLADKLKNTLLARDLLDDVSGQTMDGHHLEQMSKLLIRNGQLGRKFVAAFVKQLLSICRTQKSEIFYAFDDPVRSIIISLQASYPNEVWREASKLLTSRDWHVRFCGEHLFEPPDANHLGPGVLQGLPPNVCLDWVRKAPDARANVIVKWLPIVTTRSDGTRGWSPELEAYLDEFGDQPRVLDELSRRLRPGSWWGSIVPHLEPFIELLETWTGSRSRPEVQRWARKQIGHISAEIEASRKTDEERDAGIH